MEQYETALLSTAADPNAMRLLTFLSYPLFAIHHDDCFRLSTLNDNCIYGVRGGEETKQNKTNKTDASSSSTSATMKSCRCVLCGQDIVASCQEDCEAHMAVCPAFARVHPESGGTNPNGVYPPDQNDIQSNVTSEMIDAMSVKELRRFIHKAGLSDKDCIEKQDLQAKARDALSSLSSNKKE